MARKVSYVQAMKFINDFKKRRVFSRWQNVDNISSDITSVVADTWADNWRSPVGDS